MSSVVKQVQKIVRQGFENMRAEDDGDMGQVITGMTSEEVIIHASAAKIAASAMAHESGGDEDSIISMLLVALHMKADTEFVRTWERAYARIYADFEKDGDLKQLLNLLGKIARGEE